MRTPPFQSIAFVDGVRFVGPWERTWTNSVHEVGRLALPSGRVVVADALATGFAEYPPFERPAPTSGGRVFVAVAESTTDDGAPDWLILAAWVQFSDSEIVHWEPAFYEGFEPDDNYDPGFGVDSGTACIADASAAAALDDEAAGERLLEAVNSTAERREWCFHPGDPEVFFATRSGLGDGFYSSYWGLDANASPVCLVIDFDLMRRPIWRTVDLPLPVRRGRVNDPAFDLVGARVWVPRLPLFGGPSLRVHGAIPRVRVMDGEEIVSHPDRTWNGSDPVYDLAGARGTHIELSFRVGWEAAEPA